MARVLLIAATTGYQTRSFADAARRLGIDLVLATDRCHILENPWRDNAIPVRFDEPDNAAAALAGADVDGIVAVGDRPTLVAALTARKLGLPYHPLRAVAACRDKHRMRQLFGEAGLPVSAHRRVPVDRDPHDVAASAGFPCVLKPLGLSASRGVIRADNVPEFVSAFDRIRHILQQPEIRRSHEEWHDAIQVEQYIEGREFAVEGLMTHGDLNVLAIFDKPDPLEGPFFEETIYVTPSREPHETQEAIVATVRHAVRALGLYHGPVHAEMRVNVDGIYMLEVAARPIGGLCARALRFTSEATGDSLTLEDLVILHATGREKMLEGLILSPPASGVMMIPVPRAGVYESVAGIEQARHTHHVDDVVITAKIGQKLVPLPEGAGYTGFIFASGDEAAPVESALREAHALLDFSILPALNVVSV